jgi:mannitol/fructose-specific phosphotransferase system IIA component (Ntr-type)
MKLSQLLDTSVINVNLQSEDKEELFAEMVEMLVGAGRLRNRAAAMEALEAREAMASTGIGNGMAVPHGKSASVSDLCAALGVSKKGIDYETTDREPVTVVFLVLAEANNPGPHVECLGEIARLLQIQGFCDRLRRAANAQEALAVIKAEE